MQLSHVPPRLARGVIGCAGRLDSLSTRSTRLAVDTGIRAKPIARALQTTPWTGHRGLFSRTWRGPPCREGLLIGSGVGIAGEDPSGRRVVDPGRATVVDSPSLRVQASGYRPASGAVESRAYPTGTRFAPRGERRPGRRSRARRDGQIRWYPARRPK